MITWIGAAVTSFRIPHIARGVEKRVSAHQQIDVGAQGKACRLAELDRILCFYRAGSRYPNHGPILNVWANLRDREIELTRNRVPHRLSGAIGSVDPGMDGI